MAELREILSHPHFIGLPDSEKQKALTELIPGFGDLPQAEQMKGMAEIMGRVSQPGSAPAPAPPQATIEDPTAASLGMFGQGDIAGVPGALYNEMPTKREWAKMGLGMIPPVLGTMGGAVGAGSGLLTGGTTSIPGAMAGAALGTGTGESLRQMIAQNTGFESPETLRGNIGNVVQQGIMGGGSAAIPGGQGWLRPMVTGGAVMGGSEAAKQGITGEYDLGKVGKMAGLGLGVGILGEGAARVMDKVFFGEVVPLAEKAGKQFVDFAKANNLPYSVDAVSDKPSLAFMQAAGDYGPGMIITNWQRGKLIEKTTALSKMVNDELGLSPSIGIQNAADELAASTKSLINKKLTHAEWNKAFNGLSDDIRIDAQVLIDTVDKMGGLPAVDRIFKGSSNHTSREAEAIKRIILRGEYDKNDLSYLLNNINRKYSILAKDKDYAGIKEVGKMKGAIMEDISYTQLPELNTTLGAIRSAADSAFSENIGIISQFPALKKLVGRTDKTASNVLSLFSEGNIPAAQALRERLITTPNGENAWQALQSAYLEKVFDSCLVTKEGFGRKVFDPGKFLDWHEKYGNAAAQIMPETAGALQEWAQVSQGILKDYGRRVTPLKALTIAGASVGIGGGTGAWAGGPVGAVAIPGFSVLAALGTMGPGNWGFIRNSLTKQAAQPINLGSRLLSIPPQMEAMEAAK